MEVLRIFSDNFCVKWGVSLKFYCKGTNVLIILAQDYILYGGFVMNKHIKECAEVFLRDQGRLFDEPVVFDVSEAEDFLEECFAQYCKNIKELKRVMDDEGMDVSGLSDAEIEEQLEVFKLDDNHGYFFVQA